MSPLEIAELAEFLAEHWGEGPVALAARMADEFVTWKRTVPIPVYCDECGFSATGHHPRCSKYERTRTNGKIAQ
jgi:hypothetical protein